MSESQVSQSQTKITKPKKKGDEIASTHKDEDNDDITENGEEEKSIQEDAYKDDYPLDREN